MNQYDLRGQRAIVTGASQGMGLAIAKRLLKSGATVTIWGLDDASLPKAIHQLEEYGAIQGYPVDVSDEVAVDRSMKAAISSMGGLEILVNSAGISGDHMPLWQTSTANWKRVLDVNLNSAFFACRAALPHMIKNNYGRIVNVASIAGKEGSQLLSGYSASKAGMIAMTKSLAKELAPTGVLVNAITPGPTRTEMIDNTPPDQIQTMLAKCPMQRLLEPEEVAASVAWLVSADCSFTTGSILDLSGGRATY